MGAAVTFFAAIAFFATGTFFALSVFFATVADSTGLGGCRFLGGGWCHME